MDMSIWIVLFCIIYFVDKLPGTSGLSRRSDMGSDSYIEESKQIFNTIFHKYNDEVAPRRNFPEPVMIGVKIDVIHVMNLDVIKQIMESTVDVEMNWKDTSLSWYPISVHEISIKEDRIWTPELSFTNVLDVQEVVDSPMPVITSNGNIYWTMRMHVKTFCRIKDVTATSHDCNITIASNEIEDDMIDFNMNDSSVNVQNAFASRYWDAEAAGVSHRTHPSSRGHNDTFSEFVCTLSLTKIKSDINSKGPHYDTVKGKNENGSNGSVTLSTSMSDLILLLLSSLFLTILAQH